MTTWMLVMFLAYSNGEGGVALQSEKIDFASQEECIEAKRGFDKAIANEGFRRSLALCFKRGSFLNFDKQ